MRNLASYCDVWGKYENDNELVGNGNDDDADDGGASGAEVCLKCRWSQITIITTTATESLMPSE